MLPAIREVYRTQIAEVTKDDSEAKIKELKRQSSGLKEEEARLGRLYISGKISEETYDQLRKEWQEKLRNAEISIADLERESRIYLDDLQVALMLMTKISHLYSRLDEKDRAQLLQIVVKRIIVNPQGEIIDHELHSPFAYLRELVDGLQPTYIEPRGSEQLLFGASISKKPLTSDVGRFLSLIWLDPREKLDDIGLEIGSDTLKISP